MSRFFVGANVGHLPLVALFIFIAVFVAVAVRIALKGRSHYEPVANLPLDDGEPTSRGAHHE